MINVLINAYIFAYAAHSENVNRMILVKKKLQWSR